MALNCTWEKLTIFPVHQIYVNTHVPRFALGLIIWSGNGAATLYSSIIQPHIQYDVGIYIDGWRGSVSSLVSWLGGCSGVSFRAKKPLTPTGVFSGVSDVSGLWGWMFFYALISINDTAYHHGMQAIRLDFSGVQWSISAVKRSRLWIISLVLQFYHIGFASHRYTLAQRVCRAERNRHPNVRLIVEDKYRPGALGCYIIICHKIWATRIQDGNLATYIPIGGSESRVLPSHEKLASAYLKGNKY